MMLKYFVSTGLSRKIVVLRHKRRSRMTKIFVKDLQPVPSKYRVCGIFDRKLRSDCGLKNWFIVVVVVVVVVLGKQL